MTGQCSRSGRLPLIEAGAGDDADLGHRPAATGQAVAAIVGGHERSPQYTSSPAQETAATMFMIPASLAYFPAVTVGRSPAGSTSPRRTRLYSSRAIRQQATPMRSPT